MSKRALEAGLKAYPENIICTTQTPLDKNAPVDVNVGKRIYFMEGYKQAEKDLLAAIIPKEAMDRIHKQISCKWFCGGDCGKGLPGTPCELKGCVAWEEYKEEKL